ncbi:MAG: hypothetical protein AB1758_17280 [Candidatus Eremiobacterota bacterium]
MELGRLDCLIGPNNSGKTTFLHALAAACNERMGLSNSSQDPDHRSGGFLRGTGGQSRDIGHKRKVEQTPVTVSVEFDTGLRVAAAINLYYNRLAEEEPQSLEDLVRYRIEYLPVFSAFQARFGRRLHDELLRGRVKRDKDLLDLKEAWQDEAAARLS